MGNKRLAPGPGKPLSVALHPTLGAHGWSFLAPLVPIGGLAPAVAHLKPFQVSGEVCVRLHRHGMAARLARSLLQGAELQAGIASRASQPISWGWPWPQRNTESKQKQPWQPSSHIGSCVGRLLHPMSLWQGPCGGRGCPQARVEDAAKRSNKSQHLAVGLLVLDSCIRG